MTKNTNKKIKKILFLLIAIIVFLIIIDLIDITQYIPFSEKYDWLGIGAAIIGGILGAVATLIGINQTIQYEKKRDKDKEIENRKNNYYSYLTFSKHPVKITISLDSTTNISNIKDKIILIEKNIKINSSNYFDIELNFDMLNNIFPSSVTLNELTILYNNETVDNEIHFNDIEHFYKYDNYYNKITIKNEKNVTFVARCLMDREKKNKLSKGLEQSKRIDIIADISFLNPSKIITKGNFRVNLELADTKKIGNKNNIGSNKQELFYNSINNYFDIDNIYYIDEEKQITK